MIIYEHLASHFLCGIMLWWMSLNACSLVCLERLGMTRVCVLIVLWSAATSERWTKLTAGLDLRQIALPRQTNWTATHLVPSYRDFAARHIASLIEISGHHEHYLQVVVETFLLPPWTRVSKCQWVSLNLCLGVALFSPSYHTHFYFVVQSLILWPSGIHM